jgi:DNA polymerase-3 subunit epsilon
MLRNLFAKRPVSRTAPLADLFPFEQAVFAVLDFETTGLFPQAHHRVIEVGMVCVRGDGETLDEFETLVNPRRDLGPTHIHGIRARDVANAPAFSDIADEVASRLDGAVMVAHNVRFEQGFLVSEFERGGRELPQYPSLCTMALVGRFGTESRRRLSDCCAAYSVEHNHPHSALGDARATARLLCCLLAAARREDVASLSQLGCAPLPPTRWPSVPCNTLAVKRSKAATQRPAPSYLATLVTRLPASIDSVSDEAEFAYLDLLDRALEDRSVTEDEGHHLEALASDWGLGRDAIVRLHEKYLRGLVEVALADDTVTVPERRDLLDVCELLNVESSTLDRLLAEGGQWPEQEGKVARTSNDLRGLSVCFTGQMTALLDGHPVTRELATEMAEAHGLTVSHTVTKHLDLLIVADPNTMSGKARKARSQGTRIMAERAFWQALGISVG